MSATAAAPRRDARWARVARAAPLCLAAIAALGGIVAADAWREVGAWRWVLVAGACALWRANHRSALASLALVAAVAATWHAVSFLDRRPLPAGFAGPRSGLLGTVVSAPERVGTTDLAFRLATGERPALRLAVRVTGGAEGLGATLRAGDRVRIDGVASAPRPPRNPGGFDAPAWFERTGLAGRLRVGSPGDVVVVGRDESWRWGAAQAAVDMRRALERAVTRDLGDSPEIAALLEGMVLGNTADAPTEVEEAFRLSGATHLFAISGLHIGIFATLIGLVLGLLRLRREWTLLLVIPAVFAYAFVTGWRPSAVRAAVMLSVVLAGMAFDRQPRLANSLGAAALVILALDTHQLFSPGFQLSFIVLASIGAFAAPLAQPFRRWTEPDPFLPPSLVTPGQRRWFGTLRVLAGWTAVSLAAWAGSAALVWFHFGVVTPVAVIANVVLVPVAFAILATAVLSLALTAAGLPTLAVLANNTNWLLAQATLAVVQWFASLDLGHFHPAGSVGGAAARVTILDTGFGGAAHVVELPGTAPWMIDCGHARDFHAVVAPFLDSRGIRELGGLVLTHRDARHVGGAGLLAGGIRLRRVLAPPALVPHVAVATEDGRSAEAISRGTRIELAPGILLEVLAPDAGETRGTADDRCTVLRLSTPDGSILFASDIGFASEKRLVASGADLASEALVLGNHRADHSGTPGFVAAVDPTIVVATHARFPEYERRTPEWRRAMEQRVGARLFDQSRCGAVTVRLGPDGITATPFLEPSDEPVGAAP